MAHILVVDDDPVLRRVVTLALEAAGHSVLRCENGRKAVAYLQHDHADLLITDIVMPQTSGPQLVARYQSLHKAPLVVYMSGYADDALAQYELDPNVVFLRKPFTPASLARTVRDALDRVRGEAGPMRSAASAAD